MRSILAQYMPLPDAEPGDEGGALLPPRGKFGARGGGRGGGGSAGFYAPPPASAGAAGFRDEERGATEMSAPKAGPLGGPL